MKKLIIIFFIMSSPIVFSQKGWLEFSDENEINIQITETKTKFKVNHLDFVAVWNSKMTPNEKYGYLGGIKTLKILYKGNQIDELTNIPDSIGLGYVIMRFYDYNFDGFLDFTIQVNCGASCYSDYYLYNKKQKKFRYQKDWNIRIQKINKKEKLILTQPNVNQKSRGLFKVENYKLIKLKIE